MEAEAETKNDFKLFDLYSLEDVEVKDKALEPYINLKPKILVKTQGADHKAKFVGMRMNIVERLANRVAVPGHIGKKHKIITSWSSGKYYSNVKTILKALQAIEKKTNKNPIQVLVDAVVMCSPRDEVTIIEHAGARYPQAVDVSPMRRVNLAIRWIVQGAYTKAFGKKKKMYETLANEIILASEGNMESYAMTKKNDSEKQADSAR